MKKTRLFSLIMAAALVLTSLPVMMLPVSAEEATDAMSVSQKISLPDNTTTGWTGVEMFENSVKYAKMLVMGKTAGLKPITLYNASSSDSLYNTESAYYRITLDMRITPESEVELHGVDANKISNGSGKVQLRFNKAVEGTGVKNINLSIPTSFEEGPVVYNIKRSSITNLANLYILPHGQSDDGFYATWDVRGIKVEKVAAKDSASGDVLFAWGVYSSGIDAWDNIVVSGGYHTNVCNKPGFPESYLAADMVNFDKATYNIDDVTLLPGIYELSGNFRTDAGTADLSAFANDVPMNVGSTTATTATVDTTAKDVKYMVTIEEEMTLSELSLNWTANGASELILADLELECVELIDEPDRNANIKRGILVSGADSIAYWSADDADASVAIDHSKNYVTANLQSGISKGFEKILLYNPDDAANSLCAPGVEYTVTYYVRLNEDAEQNSNFYTFVNTTSGSTSGTPIMTSSKRVITYNWQEISRSFTQDERISYLNAYIRGINPETGASLVATDTSVYTLIDIRGIKLTEKSTGKNVFAYGIYDDTLKPSQWTFPVIMSGNTYITKHTDLSELALIPSAQGTTFNYNASNKNITLDPGKYVLNGSFAAASGSQNVKLIAYTADNGIVVGETVTVGSTKSPVSLEITIESPTTLTGYSLVVDGGTTVYAGEVRIAEKAPETAQPNVGIFMGLLLKRRTNKALSFERTNLLTNAVKEVGTPHWTIGDQTLATGEDEDHGTILCFSGITSNLTGFTYNDGRVLVPGTYEISGLIRTAKSGQKSAQRMSLNGISLGSIDITNKWQSFKYTVTLAEEGELNFKVFGGAGKTYIKDYDLANLKLIHLEEDYNNPYEIPIPLRDPGAIIADSLIPGIFSDIGTDIWAVNGQTLTLKKDGELYYALMSGLVDSRVGFTYNSGVALDPGTYVLTFDARTAAEGKQSSISVFSTGVKVTEADITDAWSTVTVDFIVEEGRTVILKFAGGAAADGLVDYCIANVKVTAK